MLTVDQAVQQWYSSAYLATPAISKSFDWSLVDFGTMILNRDVLNQGPAYCLDEIMYAPSAKSWTAIDFTPEVLEVCRSIAASYGFRKLCPRIIDFAEGDFRSMPFGADRFDTLLDFSSSDHVRDRRDLVRSEAFRVLRPGGVYIVTYANLKYSDKPIPDDYQYFGFEHSFTVEEIEKELQTAGFELVFHDANQLRSGIIARKPKDGC